MKESIIKTAHEESYSNGRSLGILINYKPFDGNDMIKYNSFPYIYRNKNDNPDNGIYIFFDTIINMNDYLLYGDNRVKRAYMEESKFDNYYDNGLDVPFEDILKWTK